ncbi:hypothetical protein V8F20_000689 [Naviculisporaceae sp. PSN 640]
MTRNKRRSLHRQPEEEGGVLVSAPAELAGDEPVTVAESITSTNADSVIFTPAGSTPEQTTPKATFALPLRPAAMDPVIERLSSLAIQETGKQPGQEQQADPEKPISKSKKRRINTFKKQRIQLQKEKERQKEEEELKKKQEQAASVEKKPQPAPVSATQAEKPSTKIARGQVMDLFDDYFGDRKLANWQRLCIDLGLEDKNISTVTQCRKVLETVHVNIYDLLHAIEERKLLPPDQQKAPLNIKKFDSVNQLFKYSEKNGCIFPKAAAKAGGKGTPLRALLRDFFGHGGGAGGGYRGRKNKRGAALAGGGVMV